MDSPSKWNIISQFSKSANLLILGLIATPWHGTVISMQQSHFNMTQFIQQLAEFIIKGEDHSSLLQINKPIYSRGPFPCNNTYTSSTNKYATIHANIQYFSKFNNKQNTILTTIRFHSNEIRNKRH